MMFDRIQKKIARLRSADPTQAPYDDGERAIIKAFANGENNQRETAIEIYHKHLRSGVFHQDPYYEFMGEVTSPVPCWIVKGRARSAITGNPFP